MIYSWYPILHEWLRQKQVRPDELIGATVSVHPESKPTTGWKKSPTLNATISAYNLHHPNKNTDYNVWKIQGSSLSRSLLADVASALVVGRHNSLFVKGHSVNRNPKRACFSVYPQKTALG